tara:strand:- start:2293 stop:3582 length:1290 start_codon:yes stop_codon:yes gene_type:complete
MAFDIGKEISTQVKTRVFKKVTGGIGDFIRGIPGIGNSGELGKLATRLGSSVDHYSFPIDVESDTSLGNHGHYIMFYINEQKHAQIRFGERESSGRGSVIEEANKRRIPGYIRKIVGDKYDNIKESRISSLIDRYEFDNSQISRDVVEAALEGIDADTSGPVQLYDPKKGSTKNKTYNGINVKRAPTKRLKTAISLYMPPDISTSYGVGYTDTEIGLFTEQAQQIISDFGSATTLTGDAAKAAARGGFSRISDEIFGGGVEAMLTQMLLATADAVPGLGGTSAVFGMRQGKVFSPRIEVAFQGLEKRKFSYTFKMTPRSSLEAEEIRAIIFAFKFNMLPEIDNDFTAGRRMIVPNTFDISYMYNGSENEFLHKISTCVLENMEVKYGGATGKYETFQGADGGAPVVETTISLSFRELETITRERALEGF